MHSMKNSTSLERIWRVGELAETAGVSADTIRHYEKKGLLQPRRSRNGYREFPEGSLERLQMIRHALAVGFTLDELSAIFKVFDRGDAPCHEVRALAATKLAELDAHLRDVTELRNELQRALRDWDARLSKTHSGERAGLLKALASGAPARRSSTNLLLRRPKPRTKGKQK
jgi:DNA-binding transcriptional MerR regulator